MPVLFCNVGWMTRYDGIDGDSIQRGGSYNNESIGHEVCDFSNVDTKVYGYVQPTGRLNIVKLGAPVSLFMPVLDRPEGMHYKTFDRLCAAEMEANIWVQS